ncbi:CDP-glycerol glycerophosphotransferase family protein [uncultured Dysosmobacter sp.]|uniref:CDP-glycerol glycerophosphotransferase family protein n=1 Tax=uncultured Dysosmobacter sp. TaxID=2591384 RepID=UPI00262FFCD7|nr:CDP-glycerol glycerophosphotransferase family protein [uncultured Dysosmobacter sp.]
MRKKLAYLIKHNSVVQLIYRNIMSTLFRFVGLFVKTDNTLVLLNSYGGEQYSDSPRVLYEKMLVDERFLQYHFVWAFESPKKFDESNCPSVHNNRTSLVMIDSPAYFITALKAKIWITNVNIERGLHFKKKSAIYLNTWHGSGFKKSGNAIKNRNDYDLSTVDIFCCDGAYMKDIFVKWFNAKESSMLYCGRPREDELIQFTDDDRYSVRKDFGIPDNKRMILYMPTWREYGVKELDYDLWRKQLGKEYIICIRQHHFSEGKCSAFDPSYIIDMTGYPDVNKLYLAADILVSDYSSAFFDYGLLGKPMFCYGYDYERYCEDTGLFLDIEKDFPNGVIRDETKLIEAIKNIDYQSECKAAWDYCRKYVTRTGNATTMCLDRLTELIH